MIGRCFSSIALNVSIAKMWMMVAIYKVVQRVAVRWNGINVIEGCCGIVRSSDVRNPFKYSLFKLIKRHLTHKLRNSNWVKGKFHQDSSHSNCSCLPALQCDQLTGAG